jgi:hypothetical protein
LWERLLRLLPKHGHARSPYGVCDGHIGGGNTITCRNPNAVRERFAECFGRRAGGIANRDGRAIRLANDDHDSSYISRDRDR